MLISPILLQIYFKYCLLILRIGGYKPFEYPSRGKMMWFRLIILPILFLTNFAGNTGNKGRRPKREKKPEGRVCTYDMREPCRQLVTLFSGSSKQLYFYANQLLYFTDGQTSQLIKNEFEHIDRIAAASPYHRYGAFGVFSL